MNLKEKMTECVKGREHYIAVALIIVATLAVFYAGMKYEKQKLSGMGLLRDGSPTDIAAFEKIRAKTIKSYEAEKKAEAEAAMMQLESGETVSETTEK